MHINYVLVVCVNFAFAKAEQEIQKTGVTEPSLTQMATVLSDYVAQQHKFSLGEKSLRMYRGAALKLAGQSEDISIKQVAVINGLCDYLGYDSYQYFVKGLNTNDGIAVVPKAATPVPKKNRPIPLFFKILIIVVVLSLASLFIYKYVNRQRWMVWQENQYVEVDFNAKRYELKQLKLYKEDRILAFQKVSVHCNTTFFNDDGSVRYWYGKNKNKELEYFTDLGLHPETGKTLKPMTRYMIGKYVCGK